MRKKIKSRMLSLLLAGIMAGTAAIPAMAAEAGDTPTTEETTTEEAAPVANDSAETATTEDAAATESTEETEEDGTTVLSDETSSDGDTTVHIYSVDPFDAEYSAGYFCISDAVGHGALEEKPYDEWDGTKPMALYGYNTERDEDTYMDHHNGVCVNGTYYDVREYVWMSEDSAFYRVDVNDGSQAGSGGDDDYVRREFHFYEAGTLDSDNPVEVSFRGVMHMTDMDIEEGYTFDQGLVDVWVSSDTRVTYRGDNTWKGTVENDNSDQYARSITDAIWVEVEGTPEKPFTYTYWYNRGHGSAINYAGNTITYELVEDGVHALPDGAEPAVGIHCATYAAYNLMPETEFKYYEFDGWYYDAALTEKAPDTIMVAEDHTFYGTYHKVAGRIDTEVVNGTITDTVDYLEFGKDATITYESNENCILESVTVDGEVVDPEQFKDQYVFTNLTEDHTIRVVYAIVEKPTEPKEPDKEDTINNTTINNKTENNETVNNKVVNNVTENNTITKTTTQEAATTNTQTDTAETQTGTADTQESSDTAATNAQPVGTVTTVGHRNVNTGDTARAGILLAVAGAAAIGLCIYYYKNRH